MRPILINPNETWVFITPSHQWMLGFIDNAGQLMEWHCADINCNIPTQGQCTSRHHAVETARKAWIAMHRLGHLDAIDTNKVWLLDFDINLSVKPGVH